MARKTLPKNDPVCGGQITFGIMLFQGCEQYTVPEMYISLLADRPRVAFQVGLNYPNPASIRAGRPNASLDSRF